MDSIHVAVTRQVKPGCEDEFEQALREFARESLHKPAPTGVHLIEPVPGTNGCEYGMLRSFDSEDASHSLPLGDLSSVAEASRAARGRRFGSSTTAWIGGFFS